MNIVRIALIITVIGFALTTVAACNTFHGMGQDIQGAGEAITGSADKTKDKMSH